LARFGGSGEEGVEHARYGLEAEPVGSNGDLAGAAGDADGEVLATQLLLALGDDLRECGAEIELGGGEGVAQAKEGDLVQADVDRRGVELSCSSLHQGRR